MHKDPGTIPWEGEFFSQKNHFKKGMRQMENNNNNQQEHLWSLADWRRQKWLLSKFKESDLRKKALDIQLGNVNGPE